MTEAAAVIKVVDCDQLPTEDWINDRIAEFGYPTRLVSIVPIPFTTLQGSPGTHYRCVFDTRGMLVAVSPQ